MSVETATVVATQVSPWIGPCIQAGAIVISAIGVGFMIWTNRAIARKRAVLDRIVLEQTDGDMIIARKCFVTLKRAGNMEQYAALDQLASNEAVNIRFILNMYESVAIGMKEGAYDKNIGIA